MRQNKMNNNYTENLEGLKPNAPEGVGGICPICEGETDKIIWVKGINNNLHSERCKQCGQLVEFMNNEVIMNIKNLETFKQRYKDFLIMQSKIPKVKLKFENIKNKLKDTLWEKIMKFCCLNIMNKKIEHLLEIQHYLNMKILNMEYSFDKFKDYPENFPDNILENQIVKSIKN